MKVSYICQNCNELIEDLMIDNEIKYEFSNTLTGEVQHDIMKKENGSRYYIESICNNCLYKLWINPGY